MKRSIKLLTAFAVAAVVAATAAALALAGGATTSSGTAVKIANSKLGRILVDGKGISLYDFVKDKGTTSVCYGACAALWPPLLTKGKPVAGPGVKASLLGTTKRKDGKLEITYGGHPLYYFVTDRSRFGASVVTRPRPRPRATSAVSRSCSSARFMRSSTTTRTSRSCRRSGRSSCSASSAQAPSASASHSSCRCDDLALLFDVMTTAFLGFFLL